MNITQLLLNGGRTPGLGFRVSGVRRNRVWGSGFRASSVGKVDKDGGLRAFITYNPT